jgi:hypothetical protein
MRDYLQNLTSILTIVNFSYKRYKSRKYLAVIDWNYHLHLPNAATNKSGDEITSRRYNQKTQQWDVKKMKQSKG